MIANLKKTWTYFLTLMLFVCLGYVFLVKDTVSAANETVKPQNITENNSVKDKATVGETAAQTPKKQTAPSNASSGILQPVAEAQNVTTKYVEANGASAAVPGADTSSLKKARLVVAGRGGYEVIFKEGDTVFDVLLGTSKKYNFVLDYSIDPTWGAFIKGIDGKENKDPYYWFLYVNGQSATSGASFVKVQTNDVIEWRYEKSWW